MKDANCEKNKIDEKRYLRGPAGKANRRAASQGEALKTEHQYKINPIMPREPWAVFDEDESTASAVAQRGFAEQI